MNYYAFHIGDYSKDTRHLSWDEDMAYRRMMDAYYTREMPLPPEKAKVYRLISASTKAQKEAVDVVLEEFFTLSADGYRQARCDAVIAESKEVALDSDARRENEKDRQKRHREERKKLFAILRDKGVVPAFDTPTVTLRELVISRESHKPVTSDERQTQRLTNPNPNPKVEKRSAHEPVEHSAEGHDRLRDRLCEAAGWQSARANGRLEIIGPILGLIEGGADIDLDVLPVIRAKAAQCKYPSWKFFINDIAQARDDRIRAAAIVSPPSQGGPRERNSNRPAPRSFVDEALAAGGLALGEGGEIVRRDAG